MNTDAMRLQQTQVSVRQSEFSSLRDLQRPHKGWVHAIRTALGMSYRQLAQRLGVTAPGAKDIEAREAAETITLRSLNQAARAMNMRLVYALVPIEGNLESLIQKRAEEKARAIVSRTSHTMRLENQEVSTLIQGRSVEEMARELRVRMPRNLWD